MLHGLAGLLIALVFASLPALADSQDQRFLSGLRDRRLFDLAERYCRDQLALPTIDDRRKAEMSVELSRTLVDQAMSVAPEARDPLWQDALSQLETFIKSTPQYPELVMLRVQAALVQLAQGELLRQEAEIVADNGPRLDHARKLLSDASTRLDSIVREIETQLRERNLKRDAPAGSLDALALGHLRKNVALQQSRAMRNLAQTFAVGSADAIASLQRAVEVLQPLLGLDPSDPLGLTARVDEITCLRLLGDRTSAAGRLAGLDELKPPPSITLRARAETVRLLLDVRQLAEAVKLAESAPPAGAESAEWDYAVLETSVAAWRAAHEAKQEQDAQRWQQTAIAQVRTIDRKHGPYWSRRAETLLAASLAVNPGSGDLDVLQRSAESLYRSGQLDKALATYDQLATLATDAKQVQRAFDASFTAAAIEQSRNRFVEAAARFRQTALKTVQLDKAREAHLAAIWATAKAYPSPTADQSRLYSELLAEHLKHWSSGATADQVRLWFGQMEEARRQWRAAVDAYRAIAQDGPLFETAIRAIARGYLTWLQDERGKGNATDELAAEAAGYFEQVITRGQGRWPERWSPIDRLAAVTAAQIWLHHARGRADRAAQILSAALNDPAEASEAWLREARLLAIAAEASLGKVDTALGRAQQIGGADIGQLVGLLEMLDREAGRAAPEVRKALGQLTLELVERRDREAKPTADQQRRIDLYLGKSLAAVGRREEALAALKQLAAAATTDGNVQAAYASLLSEGTSTADQQAALEKWREVERRSKAGTARWFQAKLGLATGHLQLGNRDRARQIIELTKLLHPDLGGEPFQSQFLAVLKQCDK